MHRVRVLSAVAATGGTLLVGGLAAVPATAEPAAPYTVVANGLNNPRHMVFTGGGDLLVAESGTGGAGPCIPSAEGGTMCYGPTGSITEIAWSHGAWHQRRVVTGLPSLAGQTDDAETGAMKGGSALGPSDVEALSGRRYVVSVGLGAAPSLRGKGEATKSPDSTEAATLPKGFGTLVLARRNHHSFRVLADIAGHEQRTNPIGVRDSNPASLLRRGNHYVVADAGGNTVVDARLFGRVRTIAAFPDQMVQAPGQPPGTLMPMQFVPTSVAAYRGDLYVSQLTGFPFPKGGSTIWRLDGGAPHAYATGLTNVTDLAFASDGTLYAVEISTEGLASGGPPIGALVRIPRGGGAAQVVAGGLFAPYGVALRGNDAYVSTGSVLAGGGEVIKVPLH